MNDDDGEGWNMGHVKRAQILLLSFKRIKLKHDMKMCITRTD